MVASVLPDPAGCRNDGSCCHYEDAQPDDCSGIGDAVPQRDKHGRDVGTAGLPVAAARHDQHAGRGYDPSGSRSLWRGASGNNAAADRSRRETIGGRCSKIPVAERS